MAEYRIIDISGWNENVSYAKLPSYGIKGGIFRITEKGNIKDSMFEKHYAGFKSVGLSIVGVYKFSYALSVAQIQAEANSVISVLKEHPDFGGVVFLDLEYDKQANLGKAMITQLIQAFKAIIVANGYKFGIYSNKSWHDNYIDTNVITDDYWVASYPASDNGTIQERLRPRFNHLKGWQFTESFRIDGEKYDMSVFDKTYIDNIVSVTQVNKDNVGSKIQMTKKEVVYNINRGTSAEDILNIARKYIGYNEYDGSFKEIIDAYNTITPLPVGYRASYYDEWCCIFVSFCFAKANALQLIGGGECGCPRLIQIFQNMGIWQEDGNIIPPPGAIILFAWSVGAQPNNAMATHVGIVEYVENGIIHTIEGNANERVARRTYPVGHGNIRGYGIVAYGSDASTTATIEEVPVPDLDPVLVIEEPVQATEQPSTPDPQPTQQTVQPTPATTPTASTEASTGTSGVPSKVRKFYGVCVADVLNVRVWPGVEYAKLKSIPQIFEGQVIEVCDTLYDNDGDPWYYIRINNVYGFASAEYIQMR